MHGRIHHEDNVALAHVDKKEKNQIMLKLIKGFEG
jgi:hypothetical protein